MGVLCISFHREFILGLKREFYNIASENSSDIRLKMYKNIQSAIGSKYLINNLIKECHVTNCVLVCID